MAGARRVLKIALSGAALLVAAGGWAQSEGQSARRPVSVISSRLLMVQGRPALPVADLALALGGTARLDDAAGAYRIQPGAAATLRFDTAARGLVARTQPRAAARDGSQAADGSRPTPPLSLYIGGLLAADHLLLQGREPYLFVEDLAAMFGATARFDAALGQWFIVGSRPGSILAFR